MRLPRVQLFPKVLYTQFRERFPKPTSGQTILYLALTQASDVLRDSVLRWAEEAVGPRYTALLRKIVEMENKGIVVDQIATRWGATDLLKDFGGELSNEATLKRREERMPDWMKAWEKITQPWVVPPILTPKEVAHIESIADECLVLMDAPDGKDPPSVFEVPTS